jgi:carboxypeptidase T
MRQLIISILLLLPLTLQAEVTDKVYWARVKAKNSQERTVIANTGASIEVVNKDDVIVLALKEELAALQKTGKVVVSFEFSALDFPTKDSKFHNFAELQDALKELSRNHSDIVTLGSIGKTLEGREIPLITIGKNQNDPSVAAVFFVGGHHAREHISVETPLKVAQTLAAQYKAGDARIQQLLNNRTVYIVPLLNVDGAEFDIETGSYKNWRKNRRANGDGSFGVDLNRNYDHHWGTVGASGNPRSDTYYGKAPFSEPETQAVRDFITSKKNITLVHSYHTFSELILYPWGHTNDRVSDTKDFQIHLTMAEKMATYNNYTVQQSSELYLTSGDTCDWAYGVLKLICFTSELDPKSIWDGGFYPGQDKIDIVFKKNWEPALYMIDMANNPARALEATHKNYGLSAGILAE